MEFVEEFSDDIDDRVELNEDPFKENYDIDLDFIENYHVLDEFFEDTENEMPIDEISKRIAKSKEDGFGKDFVLFLNPSTRKVPSRYQWLKITFLNRFLNFFSGFSLKCYELVIWKS